MSLDVDFAAQVEKTKMLLDDLARLTPDEIADVLEVQGVQGVCKMVERCALAEYLHRNGVLLVDVGAEYVHVSSTIPDGYRVVPTGRLRTPDSVQEFIRNFDSGVYPDLIAKESGS